MNLLQQFEHRSRAFVIAACWRYRDHRRCGFYDRGRNVFSVFYLLAVGVGTWFIGRNFGIFLSVLSAAAWISGDLAAGARFSSSFIPIWNSAILLAFYFIVVWLLSVLRGLQLQWRSACRKERWI